METGWLCALKIREKRRKRKILGSTCDTRACKKIKEEDFVRIVKHPPKYKAEAFTTKAWGALHRWQFRDIAWVCSLSLSGPCPPTRVSLPLVKKKREPLIR